MLQDHLPYLKFLHWGRNLFGNKCPLSVKIWCYLKVLKKTLNSNVLIFNKYFYYSIHVEYVNKLENSCLSSHHLTFGKIG